ncbi:MAG: class I SAM-dependent methyltransferase [Verrucomicrobiota bacterium]
MVPARPLLIFGLVGMLACGWVGFLAQAQAAEAPEPLSPLYRFKQAHDPDGIGKFYFDREIAQVMGHEGIDWLERPEREREERPDLLLQLLQLKPGEMVADIGAGSGYLSWRIARLVGPGGRVYAVDVQQEMLDALVGKMAERRVTNVVPVLGSVTNTALPPNRIDLAIMVDVYHEFSHPFEMMESIHRALKPNGRVVFVEYRGEDPTVPIKRLHKMTQDQVRKEMAPHHLAWQNTLTNLPRQHVLIFRK